MPQSGTIKVKSTAGGAITLKEKDKANVIMSFKLQEQQRRRNAAEAANVPAATVAQARSPFEHMGGGGPWYEPGSEPPSSEDEDSHDSERECTTSKGGPQADPSSKNPGAVVAAPEPSPGDFIIHTGKLKDASSATLLVMPRNDAWGFVRNICPTAYANAWDVEDGNAFVVYSKDAAHWNTIGQFVQIERLRNRRRLKLVVDAQLAESQLESGHPPAQSPDSPHPESQTYVSTCGSICPAVLQGAVALGLGGLLLYLVIGRLLTLLAFLSNFGSEVRGVYLRMKSAIKVISQTSVCAIMTSFTWLEEYLESLRAGTKRYVQHVYYAMLETALNYLENLRDSSNTPPLIHQET